MQSVYLSKKLKPLPLHWQFSKAFHPWKVNPTRQRVFVSGLASSRISLLNPQSQSYCLSEGSQQLPKGDTQPSAAVQPLSRPSGSGQPEAHQPVSTFPLQIIGVTGLSFGPSVTRHHVSCRPLCHPAVWNVITRHYFQAGKHFPQKTSVMIFSAKFKNVI